MVGVDGLPFKSRVRGACQLVNEVAAVSVAAEALLFKRVATFRFVGPICIHIDPQLLRAVSELALAAIGTVALFSEVLAERTLCFAAPFPT